MKGYLGGTMRKEALSRYVELTQWIRELSAPSIADISSAEEYRMNLLRSFMRIGELAKMNENILNEYIYPLLDPNMELNTDDIEAIREFCSLLMDPTKMENVDLPMIYLQSKKLLEAASKKDDIELKIIALDLIIMSSYPMFVTTYRLYPHYDICTEYRDAGIKAGKVLLSYLDKEKFAKLPNDFCKTTVLINSRYISSLFSWFDKEKNTEERDEDLETLKSSLALCKDEFYINEVKDYDWKYHEYRTLEYIACLSEQNNINGYSKDQLLELVDYSKKFNNFVETCDKECEEASQDLRNLYMYRNEYLAGLLSVDDYKYELRKIFNNADINKYEATDIYLFFTAPNEYLLIVDKDNLSKEDKEFLAGFYRKMVSYVYHLPSSSQLSFIISFISDTFKAFIEIDEAPSFKTLCLELMAAFHPPTYVHTLSVADFATCLTNALIDKEPERFVGLLGCKSVEEVLVNREDIIEFSKTSALLHDVGKILIIETIMTYSRKLFPSEFDVIKVHPTIGAELLRKYDSTKDFVSGAFGHHKWVNNKDGYPLEFDLSKADDHVIVSILAVADCLDASTDTIGRNYKQSKGLDDYIEELIEGRGVRYADYLVDLMQEEEVYNEIALILENSRDENYRQTYKLLKQL